MYDHVIWPEPFHPNMSAIHGLNAIDVEAPADTVWRLLADAERWPARLPSNPVEGHRS